MNKVGRTVVTLLVSLLWLSSFSMALYAAGSEDGFTVLLKERQARVLKDGSMTTVIHSRIRVNNSTGVKELRKITVFCNRVNEDVAIKFIKLVRNGKIREEYSGRNARKYLRKYELETSNVRIDKADILLPQTEPGDILAYEFAKIDKKPLIKGQFWNCFIIDGSVPISKAGYVVKVPQGKRLFYRSYGLNNLKPEIKKNRRTGEITYSWKMNNFHPAALEDSASRGKPYIAPRILISSTNDWSQVAVWYRDLYEKKIVTHDSKIAALAVSLVKGKKSLRSRIEAITDYVSDKIAPFWDEVGSKAFEPIRAGKVLELKRGDCKGKVVLLIAMLRAIGVEAYPALVSGSSIPLDRLLPNPYYLDHAIVMVSVSGNDLWIDPLRKEISSREALVLKSQPEIIKIGQAGLAGKGGIKDES